MRKYKCPECGEKEMEKRVYTEERCDGCGHVNHRVHHSKTFAKKGVQE